MKQTPATRLADQMMNRAMTCEKADRQELATAHLEIAMKILIEDHSHDDIEEGVREEAED